MFMPTTQDKHNLGYQRVARLQVKLAQGVDRSERLRYLVTSLATFMMPIHYMKYALLWTFFGVRESAGEEGGNALLIL